MVTDLPSVKLEHFEGPFDLLIDLARKQKLDLSEVSLKQITDDFLGYMNERDIPAEAQGDFLVVASTLLLLKVRHLLPSLLPEEEEEVHELADRLRVYQLYRERAERLQEGWGSRRLLPGGFWKEGREVPEVLMLPEIQLPDIVGTMERLIDLLPKPVHPRAHLTARGRTLQEARRSGLFHFWQCLRWRGREIILLSKRRHLVP